MARARDEIREPRISMEIIIDACDSSEGAVAWYCCLDGKIEVPFKARCRLARPSPFSRLEKRWKSSVWRRKRSARAQCLLWVGRGGASSVRWRVQWRATVDEDGRYCF